MRTLKNVSIGIFVSAAIMAFTTENIISFTKPLNGISSNASGNNYTPFSAYCGPHANIENLDSFALIKRYYTDSNSNYSQPLFLNYGQTSSNIDGHFSSITISVFPLNGHTGSLKVISPADGSIITCVDVLTGGWHTLYFQPWGCFWSFRIVYTPDPC